MKIIDACQKACPIPVVLAKKAIESGERTFCVRVDNSVAVENLKRFAESQSFETEVLALEGLWEVRFGLSHEVDVVAQSLVPPGPGSWTVFVGRRRIGEGDPHLGAQLMRMFFYTLAQSQDIPASILFMNEGVFLTVEEAQVIDHLRELSKKGTRIVVCGACLDFYQLKEKLRAGQVSNMYDILEAMKQADKVVSL